MKRLIFLATLIFVSTIGLKAQTPQATPNRNTPVVTTQGFIDDATKAFTEIVALRDALQKEQMANGAGAVTKAALQSQIEALNGLIAIFERKDAIYQSLLDLRDQAFAVYEKVIKIQSEMIERLTNQINKGKSGWQKFLGVLTRIADIALGIAVGRVL